MTNQITQHWHRTCHSTYIHAYKNNNDDLIHSIADRWKCVTLDSSWYCCQKFPPSATLTYHDQGWMSMKPGVEEWIPTCLLKEQNLKFHFCPSGGGSNNNINNDDTAEY